jgi:hypothetical protein
MTPRSYHLRENNLVIVDTGDYAARERLKKRGYTKLRTNQVPNALYWRMRGAQPGSYVLGAGSCNTLIKMDVDFTREKIK